MKRILSFIAVCFITLTVSAQEFKFETETIDYGKVAIASEGKRTFEFTNIGDEPIIIKDIISACGCTVPKKPEAPIMPGQKGQIEVSYDTKKPGGFSKTLTVVSNAKNKRKRIKIKGFIAKKDAAVKAKSL
ncbi:DUF1573 domain-containing protein [Tenacibaculum dicentrarchi]|uniref:DUF1573 domain-containing protein n=1 Tax=Tenacibaculum dicentrarchi TaxID=669041 RepID=UPI001BE4E731|nr:DUF1573 domain-containing protein [Tenacibaculum dicentrarchi]MCD8420163.1 DUF1573 domain-containing protein [Tenacibaculum dicentrarchi]MCD8437423.1 DUF1573 domain-containing protein [Tenacibaculum dicentrarchi]MCD8451619.1 DUF1573 domain-containing protein [Tenacibaculum dicentrarchi]MCG8828067.1 DUF1573 domain-containing protein [Tenacibaculum dicentrarchi]